MQVANTSHYFLYQQPSILSTYNALLSLSGQEQQQVFFPKIQHNFHLKNCYTNLRVLVDKL